MTRKFSIARGRTATFKHHGVTKTVVWQDEPAPISTVDLYGGRVSVVDDELVSVSSPDAALTLRSDGKTTLDLRKVPDAQTLTAQNERGDTIEMRVAQIVQKRGFSDGEHYWLLQDKTTGRFKIEPGRRHRKIYVSASGAAMTQAMIAAHATEAGTPTTESQVTGSWLIARPQYGGTQAMAVTDAVRKLITDALWTSSQDPRSDWVLWERGYDYGSLQFGNKSYWRGESELHPIVFGAWGEGARPKIGGLTWTQFGPRFLVLRDIRTNTFYPKHGLGNLVENCRITGSHELNLSDMGQITYRETAIYDIVPAAPKDPSKGIWSGSEDRISGSYASFGEGIMFDSCAVDRNGWAPGYDFNRSMALPYPPSDRNHGLYLNYDNLHIHVRDSLISRNSSAGLQIRSGGQYERNMFVDNNYACGLHSGSDLGTIGQFTNFMDNVNFGAGYKRVVSYQGIINGGFDLTGKLTGMVGNIIAHLADPDNAAEIADRKSSDPTKPDWDAGSPYNKNAIYSDNDTKVYKWGKNREGAWLNERVEGLSETVLNQTTLQRRAGIVLGQASASLEQFARHLIDNTENEIGETIYESIQWVQARFGQPLLERTTPADLVFRPDPRFEAFRADNRYNWNTLDYPGMNVADTINLDGHKVMFGTRDYDVAALRSRSGKVDLTSGSLNTGSLLDTADVTVRRAGQFICGATTQDLKINAMSGRAWLNGAVSKLNLEARGRAEVLLGPDTTATRMILSGQKVLVGWDGTGTAKLTLAGPLELRVGMKISISGGAGYFQKYIIPGNRITTDNFSALVAEYEERSNSDTNRPLWLSDIAGMPVLEETFLYGYRSVVANHLDLFEPKTARVMALQGVGLPMLQRFRSGAIGDGLTDPTVAVNVELAAGFDFLVDRPDLLPANYTQDVTGPGITVTNPGNIVLPAGLTLTSGKLVYAKP